MLSLYVGSNGESDTMEELKIKPHGERVLTYKHPNIRVEFESGNVQVQARTVNPIKIWELKFSGTKEEAGELERFFNKMRGGVGTFLWRTKERTEDGTEKETLNTVRFENDEIKFTEKYGLRDDGTYGCAAYETTIQIRKVWS